MEKFIFLYQKIKIFNNFYKKIITKKMINWELSNQAKNDIFSEVVIFKKIEKYIFIILM